MAEATLDEIESALFNQLRTLTIQNEGPFLVVDRIAVDSDQPSPEDILAATGGKTPAALLSLESEDPVPDLSVQTLVGWDNESISRSTWRVYIVVGDSRGDSRALKGDQARAGMLKLCGHVKLALLNFRIPGTAGTERVKYLGTRVIKGDRGSMYVRAARFTADYAEPQQQEPMSVVPFKGLDGDLNLPELHDPDNPVVQIRQRFF